MIICASGTAIPLHHDSVQCVVTSPPYWRLRKYAGEQELVWENPAMDAHLVCEHQWGEEIISTANDSNRGSMVWTTGGNPAAKILGAKVSQGNICRRCHAWRGAYGLEPTVQMYVDHTVQILREIRRVLRPDGVVFWNIGSSRWGGGNSTDPALKAKDLCLIPQRVMLAAQADGWWVRSDIIWAKTNPMPESCRDRPTDAYEHIIMLTKSARYYFDGRDDGTKSNQGFRDYVPIGRRNVWTFATQPYSGAHFATFPEELPRRCILAATSAKGACVKCGTPWERVTERTGHVNKREPAHVPGNCATKTNSTGWAPLTRATDNWRPTCSCGAEETRPCVVLDPFGGSGTTGRVAIELRRTPVLLDIAYTFSQYDALADKRTRNVQIGLLEERP